MKRTIPIVTVLILLLGLVMSMSCLGVSVADLKATYVPPDVAATVSSITATQTAQATPSGTPCRDATQVAVDVAATVGAITATQTALPLPTTPPQKVALVSFHGRYVTAEGSAGRWLLGQESGLSDCGLFTLDYLDNGKVALKTCHDRYVTAPKTGVTRSDWRLWQETELRGCGQFTLYDLGENEIALETCAENVITAGDGGWEEDLAWAIVGETDVVRDWERFKPLRLYPPLQSMVVNFDGCAGVAKLDRRMGPAYAPGDMLVESYVKEDGRGCIAKLEYDTADWAAFWIQLQRADLSPYTQIVFDIRADTPESVPQQVKIELKRAGNQQISVLRHDLSEVTSEWQTMSVNLSDFEGSASTLTDIEELVFTFESGGSRTIGVIYLDNIALRRGEGIP